MSTTAQLQADFEYIVKILGLGDSGVGKTAFLNRYIDEKFIEEFVSTVGIDFREKQIVHFSAHTEGSNELHGQPVHLQFWDTAGQERFRGLTRAFFRDAMGFLVMFDLTLEESFVNVRKWLSQLEVHADCDVPAIILIGNKCDLKDKRVVQQVSAVQLADTLGIKYFETSALTGENVKEVVDSILDLIMEQIDLRRDCMACKSFSMENNVQLKEPNKGYPKTIKSNCANCY